MLKEFKDFILRGNVVDLAIAVVLGVAFGEVVKAAIDDLIMPIIAAVGGQPDFAALDFTINDSVFLYGHFINTVVAFVTLAAVIFFFVVKPMNLLLERVSKKKEPETAAPPEDVVLLREIRDLLKSR